MNIGTNEIELRLKNIFNSNSLNLDIEFQYSSFEDYDIQCSVLLKIKNDNLIDIIKKQIKEDLLNLFFNKFSKKILNSFLVFAILAAPQSS